MTEKGKPFERVGRKAEGLDAPCMSIVAAGLPKSGYVWGPPSIRL
jgi:hypothetical protein